MAREAERKLRQYLEENGCDGFFVSNITNVRYVSGYTGDDSCLLFTKEKKYFITDPRYTEQAALECPEYELANWRSGHTIGSLAVELAAENGVKKLGFEANYVSYLEYQTLSRREDVTLVPTVGVVDGFRVIKSEDEILCSRRACDITVRAFNRILGDIRVGVTEKELAANLSRYMVLEGADTMPYGNILISGARTSLLHGIPSEKAVEYGDLVLMDFGCQYKGYMSDMTRTVVVGKATDEIREVYELEQSMLSDMEEFIRDGVACSDVYQVSIRRLKDTRYFAYHYTGIGHGCGLFVHEHPFISPSSKDIIHENTVMTVEPGVYIPGWGGIRIEDTILVHKDGIEVLTPARKELIEL